jgi:hypothetical protein
MKHLFLFLFAIPSLYARDPFSLDSALSYLKTISVTIGARPMGSPNERRTMEFALAKFREFGLDESYFIEMKAAESEMTRSSINTNSGIAVGVLRGKTDRIIVIGAHIDSASPDIPGANDNGSGSAVAIELARVLSKEQHQSTFVFCLFGGEEAGLCGSDYFVKHFPQLDSVVLMQNIDMANGSDILIPTVEIRDHCTPKWLVKAAFEEIDKLGYSGLKYPTHFFTFMNALPGGVSSDFEPFLREKIPAMDLSSDLNDPIHTPQDDFEHFKPDGLKRSGDLVYALVNRFDKGVPEEKIDKYYLLQIGTYPFFLPLWLLNAFILISIILAIYVVLVVRNRRIEIEKSQRPKIPALKLFVFALFIQTCVWLSENLIGLIKGIRFPWISHPDGYFILGFFAALVGITISLILSPRFKLSHDPYRWFLRAIIFLLMFIALTAFAGTKLVLYPATALFFLTLAMVVRHPLLKLLFWIISPYLMFQLIFSEGFLFTGRMGAFHATQSLWMYAVLHLFYIIFFALWSFPFMLGFVAIYFDSGVDLLWLKRWQTKTGIIVIVTAFILCSIILTFIPAYSDEWRQNIIIDQSVDMNTGKGKIILKGSEYLKHLRIHLVDKDTNISSWDRETLLKEFPFDGPPWIQIERTVTTLKDSNTTFDLLVKLHLKYQPRSLTLSYLGGKNKLEDVSTPFASNITEHNISLRWQSFPDTSLLIPIHFRVVGADSVTESIEAKFVEVIESIQIEKEFSNIISQTTMRQKEVIKH